MRKENDVLKQILDFAREENRVRAVMMNGSRVNNNAIEDIMRDYDVVFLITDIGDKSYKANREWIKRFGELVILQQNDIEDGSYIFLMQFKDGVRIDLCFNDIEKVNEIVREDTLTKILLDKDNRIPTLPYPNDSMYYVKRPSQKEFDEVLNEAWWIQTYVAKGIWRDELPLVKYMFDVILIDCIRKILSWYLGTSYNWSINSGKCGKWFKRYLQEDVYKDFAALYPGACYEDIWHCLFKAGEFIRRIGTEVAEKLGYDYPINDDINVTEYLKRVKDIPGNADDFI